VKKRIQWNVPIRTKLVGQLGVVFPEVASLLIEHYQKNCSQKGLIHLNFKVDGLPLSLNHQYDQTLPYCKEDTPGAFQDKAGRWRVRSTKLKADAMDWRLVLMEAMGTDRWKWKPTGVTAAILLLETPYWLTQKRLVREMDADNKTKPIFDAVQYATETPDELHWQFHVFKVLSKRQRTTIFLYDLGDVVEYYY
jgi:hypothetical protein